MTNKTEENGQAPDLMEELQVLILQKPLRRGEIIDGKIMEINDEGLLLIDINLKELFLLEK